MSLSCDMRAPPEVSLFQKHTRLVQLLPKFPVLLQDRAVLLWTQTAEGCRANPRGPKEPSSRLADEQDHKRDCKGPTKLPQGSTQRLMPHRCQCVLHLL